MPIAMNEAGEAMSFDGKAWVKAPIAADDKGGKVAFDGKDWVPLAQATAEKQAPSIASYLLPFSHFPAVARTPGAEKVTEGVLRGMRDPIDAGAQLVTRGLEAAMPAGSGAERFMQGERQNVEQINRTAEDQYQAGRAQRGGSGFDPSRLVGNIAGTAPLAAALPATVAGSAVAGGALAGGATGAMQPVYGKEGQPAGDYWLDKLKQLGLGAGGGAAGSMMGKVISRIISPNVSPEVKTLMDAGVSPTPGQVMGGAAKRVEDATTSIPLVGDAVRMAQKRAVEDFNRGAINRALEPISEKLDGKTLLGRDAIDEAITKVSKAYDDLLPKLTTKADPRFVSDMGQLHSLTRNMLPERAAQFDKIVADKLFSKMNPSTGTISGEALKEAESELGRLAAKYGGSLDGDQQILGDALKQTVANLRSLVERSNPQYASELKNINTSYAQVLRLQNAASRLGSEEGVFSPAQLLGAVRQMDRSLNKRQFARGDALMQDFAEAGKTVLGPRVPDSGTPTRALVAGGLLGSAGAGAGALAGVNPLVAGGLGAGLLGGYTPLGQRATAALLARRPGFATPLAQAVEETLPYLGSAGGLLAVGR